MSEVRSQPPFLDDLFRLHSLAGGAVGREMWPRCNRLTGAESNGLGRAALAIAASLFPGATVTRAAHGAAIRALPLVVAGRRSRYRLGGRSRRSVAAGGARRPEPADRPAR